jgi:hypothetical protein
MAFESAPPRSDMRKKFEFCFHLGRDNVAVEILDQGVVIFITVDFCFNQDFRLPCSTYRALRSGFGSYWEPGSYSLITPRG